MPVYSLAVPCRLAYVVALEQSNIGSHIFLSDVEESGIADQADPERIAVSQGLVEVLRALLRVLLL